MKQQTKVSEMTSSELHSIERYADTELDPIDVEFGNHFFDRLNDPRNGKEITRDELITFFSRLSKKKDAFMSFIKRYGEFVVKDKNSSINIPFVSLVNQALAKTIMRKPGFTTPDPTITLQEASSTKNTLVNIPTTKSVLIKKILLENKHSSMKQLMKLIKEEMTPAEQQAKKSAIALSQEKIKDATKKLPVAKSALEKKAAQDQLVVAKQELQQATAIQEEAGKKYTPEESKAVGKVVAKSLLKVMRKQGDEVVAMTQTDTGANGFNVRVKYGHDKGQDLFKFKLNPDTKNISIEVPKEGDTTLTQFLITQGNTVSLTTPELEDNLTKALLKYVSQPTDEVPQQEEPLMEKHLTSAETKKREEIVKGLAKSGMKKSPKLYAIATAKAIKVAEDISIGHEDNEPHMIQGDLYAIKDAVDRLCAMVKQLQGPEKVDFPHWWQAKIITAKAALSGAEQYLEFEMHQPNGEARQEPLAVAHISLAESKKTK